MKRHTLAPGWRVLFFVLFVPMMLWAGISQADEFLDPTEAFPLSVLQRDQSIVARWEIPAGYKLYKDRIRFTVDRGDLSMGTSLMPPAKRVYDKALEKWQDVYEGPVEIAVPVVRISTASTLIVGFQGCANDGLCYPPAELKFNVLPGDSGPLKLAGAPGAAPEAVEPTTDDYSAAGALLASGSPLKIIGGFFLFGLLLSLTPCVLPMLPILSASIVNAGCAEPGNRRGSLGMATAYCLGMALVYTSLGVAAGLAGEGLAPYLQQPWLLLTFGSLMFLFALSMFDAFQFQLPVAAQSWLSTLTQKLQAKSFLGVFLLGALSSLIVGPCVAAPLAGALVYLSRTGDVFLGGGALFSMAAGMSVPLLLIGASMGKLLPKAGPWMAQIKYFFGFLLMATALWMVSPLLSPQLLLAAIGTLLIFSAIYLRLFSLAEGHPTFGANVRRLMAIVLFLLGTMEWVGAVAGARDPLQPLESYSSSAVADKTPGTTNLKFRTIDSPQDLERVLSSSDKPVLIDFYADWCASCIEMERFTFSDDEVRSKLAKFDLLRVDVTKNSPASREILKRFGLFGPPAVVLLTAGCKESGQSLVGFAPSGKLIEFLTACDQAAPPTPKLTSG